MLLEKETRKKKKSVSARDIAQKALREAYKGEENIPEGALDLLQRPEKPGTVVAIFHFGRSGSYLLSSLFQQTPLPELLPFPALHLTVGSSGIGKEVMRELRCALQSVPPGVMSAGVEECSERIMVRVEGIFEHIGGDPYLCRKGPGPVINFVRKDVFKALLESQMIWRLPRPLDYDFLLKSIFIAYHMGRGEPLACHGLKNLVYMWQPHIPTPGIRHWIRRNFPNCRTLIPVRFPEKALDSLLIHSVTESHDRAPERVFHFCLSTIAEWYDELTDISDRRDVAIRFEDMHHHTHEVIQAVCDWLNIDKPTEQVTYAMDLAVRGKIVSGVRNLSIDEMQPKYLSYSDIVKVRFLLQENYRMWGYDAICQFGFERSIREYRDLIKDVPFACQEMIASFGRNYELACTESTRTRALFIAERSRRDRGIQPIPLLYDKNKFPIHVPGWSR